MSRKAIFGYPSVIEKLGTGGGGDISGIVEHLTRVDSEIATLQGEYSGQQTQIQTLEDEYASLLTGTNNYLTEVKLQTTQANSRSTIDKNNIRTVIAVFDKSKFSLPISDLVDIQYHRYNTAYDAAWIINFGWYRINSSATETASSTDKIYCVFTFLDPAVTESNATDYIGATNKNMLIFRFRKTIGV